VALHRFPRGSRNLGESNVGKLASFDELDAQFRRNCRSMRTVAPRPDAARNARRVVEREMESVEQTHTHRGSGNESFAAIAAATVFSSVVFMTAEHGTHEWVTAALIMGSISGITMGLLLIPIFWIQYSLTRT